MRQPNVNKIKKIWWKYPPKIEEGENNSFTKEEIFEKLGSIFCPGPFFFSVFHFGEQNFVYTHPRIEKVLGIHPKEWNLNNFIERIHPHDREYMARCEKLVGEFLFNFLPKELILTYKPVYNFRMRKENGKYSLFMQQAVALKLDKDNKVVTSFVVHTDISQICNSNSKKISLLSLNGGKDYLGVDPYKGMKLIPQTSTRPLSNREIEVLTFLAEGDSLPEIGDKLFISPHTVRTHRNNIRKKLDCQNIGQAIARAIKEGWL
ncbi:MAG: LuxR C-terminal-related transcriptional regulator [Bacteroidota bacterium]